MSIGDVKDRVSTEKLAVLEEGIAWDNHDSNGHDHVEPKDWWPKHFRVDVLIVGRLCIDVIEPESQPYPHIAEDHSEHKECIDLAVHKDEPNVVEGRIGDLC